MRLQAQEQPAGASAYALPSMQCAQLDAPLPEQERPGAQCAQPVAAPGRGSDAADPALHLLPQGRPGEPFDTPQSPPCSTQGAVAAVQDSLGQPRRDLSSFFASTRAADPAPAALPARHAADVSGDAYAVTCGDTGERVYCCLAPQPTPAQAGAAALRDLRRGRGPLLGRPIDELVNEVS